MDELLIQKLESKLRINELMLEDLVPLIPESEEKRQEIFQQLREIYDGCISAEYGEGTPVWEFVNTGERGMSECNTILRELLEE